MGAYQVREACHVATCHMNSQLGLHPVNIFVVDKSLDYFLDESISSLVYEITKTGKIVVCFTKAKIRFIVIKGL